MKGGSLGWVVLAAVLLAQAQPASTPVLRWPDIVAARSNAPNGIWFSTIPGGGH